MLSTILPIWPGDNRAIFRVTLSGEALKNRLMWRTMSGWVSKGFKFVVAPYNRQGLGPLRAAANTAQHDVRRALPRNPPHENIT